MTNAELNKTVTAQQETIAHLRSRIGDLVDELETLRLDVGNFKTQVANDMNRVVKTLQSK